MKKLILLFSLILIAATAQSQSLTEKELTGTWQVVTVADNGNNPNATNELSRAMFNFNADHSFELKKISTSEKYKYNTAAKSNRWSYNAATQTIKSGKFNLDIKVSKSNNKIFFVLLESGVKLEVEKPM